MPHPLIEDFSSTSKKGAFSSFDTLKHPSFSSEQSKIGALAAIATTTPTEAPIYNLRAIAFACSCNEFAPRSK